MGDKQPQSTVTPHGEIEYETVACENCDSDVLTDEAVYVGIGLKTGTCSGINDHTYDTYRRSVALCDYCAEETLGITGRLRQEIKAPHTPIGAIAIGLAVGLGFIAGESFAASPILTVLATLMATALSGLLWLLVRA